MADTSGGALLRPVTAIDADLLEGTGLKDHGCDQLDAWFKALGEGSGRYSARRFDLPAFGATGSRSIRSGLLVAAPEPSERWRPSDAYGELKPLHEAIDKALGLTSVRLRYSSYDFAAVRAAAAGADAADLRTVEQTARSLDASWPHDLARLRAGMNFAGEAVLLPDLDAELRRHIGLDASMSVAGCVGRAGDGCWIELSTALSCAPLRLMDGRLSIALARASVGARGIRAQNGAPRWDVTLHGRIALDDQELEVSIAVDPVARELTVSAHAPNLIRSGKLVGSLVPDLGKTLGDALIRADDFVPGLRGIQVRTPLTGLGGARVALWLGYARPFRLFDLIEIRPSLYAAASYDGSDVRFEALLTGNGAIRNGSQTVAFETMLSLPDCSFRAGLAEGSTISLPEDVTARLDKVTKGQNLRFIDLAIEGNTRKGSYSLTIATAGFLAFSVGKGRLLIGDVRFNVARSPAGLSARLEAMLGIGNVEAEIDISIDEVLEARFTVPRLPIGDIAADLLQIEAPGEMAAAEIKDFEVALTLGDETAFRFEAKSDSTFTIAGLKVCVAELGVAYNRSLSLKGKGRIWLDDTQVELDLVYARENWNFSFGADTSFDLGRVLGLLAKEIGFEAPFAPGSVTVRRVAGAFRLGPDGTRVALNFEFRINGGDFRLTIVAARLDRREKPGWECSIRAGPVSIDFGSLPLIGAPIRTAARALAGPDDSTYVGLDELTIGILSTIESAEIAALFEGLPGRDFPKPATVEGKVSLAGKVRLLEYEQAIAYPEPKPAKAVRDAGPVAGGGPAPANAPAVQAAPAATAGAGAAKPSWIEVNRDLGPVRVDRIGFALDSSKRVSLFLDAGAKIGPVTARVIGLEVKTPILEGFKPEFSLAGVEVSCKNDAFTLAGALLANPDLPGDYAGSIVISFGKITVTAMGAYAEVDGQPSLFVFAALLAPIGGPAFFFVNGLSGGVGFNRALAAVTAEGVSTHPFVEAAMGKRVVPIAEVAKLTRIVPGQKWAAIGVRFTSFQLMDGVAILIVSFGVETRIQVLARLDFAFPPKPADPMLYVELGILADYRPDQGELRVEGRISPNSFLLHKDAKLSGGFALYVWMAPSPHAGDFVLTLGGYHPRFERPKHYPDVPPLQLKWQVSDEVAIVGRQYFALTPSFIMAGGSLALTWQSGRDRAWFEAEVHFLIRFKPFTYSAVVSVSVGLVVTIGYKLLSTTFSVSLGVQVALWGPPFGGRARVNFKVFSVTIAFGAGEPREEKPLAWGEFRQTFLPPLRSRQCELQIGETDTLITLGASGLRRRFKPVATGIEIWEIDPAAVEIEVRCLVPLSQVRRGGAEAHAGRAAFGVPPMGVGLGQMTSTLELDVYALDGQGRDGTKVTDLFDTRALTAALPSGFWGAPRPEGEEMSGDALIQGVLNGATLASRKSGDFATPFAAAAADTKERGKATARWSSAGQPQAQAAPAEGWPPHNAEAASRRRDAMIARLATAGIPAGLKGGDFAPAMPATAAARRVNWS